MSQYTSIYKCEVLEFIDKIEKELQLQNPASEYNETKTICKFFLASIFQQVRGGFALIDSRNSLAFDILNRSMWEHAVDLQYISINDDDFINRLFNSYCGFVSYKRQNEFENIQVTHAAKEMSKEYQKFVLENREKLLSEKELEKCENEEGLFKAIKKKYSRHWSGLPLPDRIKAIKRLFKSKYPTNQNRIMPYEEGNFGHFFNIHSNFTHPTPFSVYTNFDASKFEHHYPYIPADETMLWRERRVLLVLNSSLMAFSDCLFATDNTNFKQIIREQVKLNPEKLKLLYI